MSEKALLEDVFVTEGVPEHTFVKPPNFTALLVDIRRLAKPVIVEGQSGTGKTTAVKKVIAEAFPENSPKILTPRDPKDLPIISQISEGSGDEIFIIDDFHRLEKPLKEKIANLAKMIAEREDRSGLPKIVIVGINEVGADLIQLVPDIAKRIGIHKISSGNRTTIGEIIGLGSEALNVEIEDHDGIFKESGGDYWLTQQLCKTICISDNVSEAQPEKRQFHGRINRYVISLLDHCSPTMTQRYVNFAEADAFAPLTTPTSSSSKLFQNKKIQI